MFLSVYHFPYLQVTTTQSPISVGSQYRQEMAAKLLGNSPQSSPSKEKKDRKLPSWMKESAFPKMEKPKPAKKVDDTKKSSTEVMLFVNGGHGRSKMCHF